ncbi:sulfotransferase 1B1-like [Babylonia areolata]|uniref:sulfotransferase 1B1-like n=1 Tax=Babylonia areolata TaxID=304850 RepID=UPI003FD21EC7
MTLVEMPDKSGSTLKLLEVDGKLFTRLPVDNVKNYRHLPIRHDDVILCAYPKSGTHWLWEVSTMLLAGKAETVPYNKSQQMMENCSADDLARFPSPRVLNTHVHYDDLPRDALALGTRLILVARNPKDVAVSMYNHHVGLVNYFHYSGAFGDWLTLFLEGKVNSGSWFDYMVSWEKVLKSDVRNPIHVIMYEDMQEDPVRETSRLAEFLGVTLDPEVMEKIVTKCSFSNMSVEKKSVQESAKILFRKGVVGGWRNVFTVGQSEDLDALLEERLKETTWTFRYQL